MQFRQTTLGSAPARRSHLLAGVAFGLLVSVGVVAIAQAADGGAGGSPGGGAGGAGNSGAAGHRGSGFGGTGGNAGNGINGGDGGNGGDFLASARGGNGGQNETSPVVPGAPGTPGPGGAGGDGGQSEATANFANSTTGENVTAKQTTGGGGGGGGGGAGLIFTPGGFQGSAAGGGGAGGNGGAAVGNSSTATTTGGAANALATSTVVGGGGGGGGGAAILALGNGATYSFGGTFTGGAGGDGGGNDGTGGARATAGANGDATAIAISGPGGNGGNGGSGIAVFGRRTTTTLQPIAISGGNGGDGGAAAPATSLAASTAVGAGAILTSTAIAGAGGRGGRGGDGVNVSGSRASLTIDGGMVTGGNGGRGAVGGIATAVGLAPGLVINGAGLVDSGGAPTTLAKAGGGGGGGAGGNAVTMSGAGSLLVNTATLTGGTGGDAGTNGGIAVAVALGNSPGGATATAIAGGGGAGGTGGAGVLLAGRGATFDNFGTVLGGNGGLGSVGGFGVPSAISLGSGSGRPSASNGPGGAGGDGGAGLIVTGRRAVLSNAGTITGGDGGLGGIAFDNTPAADGAGGIGVVAAGIRIDNTGGTITGGFAGAGGGAQNFAIEFTGYRNFVGGDGQIVGGIDVRGQASFMPALPGSPVGTPLVIEGPLRFARTATYAIRINGGANDSVILNGPVQPTVSVLADLPSRSPPPAGTATLDGAKVFVRSPAGATAPVRGLRYTIVTATNGVVGKFRPIVGSNLAFFAPTLAYDPTHVYLDAKYNYALPALTLNEQRVGLALNNAARQPLNGVSARIFNALETVRKAQGPAVLDSLSGEGITATQNLAYRMGTLFTSSIFDQTTFYGPGAAGNSITLSAPLPAFFATAPQAPIRELADVPARHQEPVFVAPARTWRAWATGYGGAENIDGNAFPIGSANQHNTLYGGVLGVDYQVTPNYLFGVALGGSSGDFQVPGRGTYGSTTGGQVAIYDLATFGAFYGASSSSFAYYGNRTTRTVAGFGNLGGETERGTFDSHEFRSRLEFGRHIDGYGMSITPFVALEIAQFRSNGFGETSQQGAGLFRLNVSGMSQASVPSFVGLRFQRLTPIGGMTFMPTLQVAWVHEFAPYRQQYAAIADLPGASFLIDGARPAYNAAQVKVGGELQLRPGTALFANFDGEFSGVNQFYAGKGGVRWTW